MLYQTLPTIFRTVLELINPDASFHYGDEDSLIAFVKTHPAPVVHLDTLTSTSNGMVHTVNIGMAFLDTDTQDDATALIHAAMFTLANRFFHTLENEQELGTLGTRKDYPVYREYQASLTGVVLTTTLQAQDMLC